MSLARYTTNNENVYWPEQGYNVSNPLLTKGEQQYTTTYQNNIPAAQQEVVYTTYANANQPATYGNYVVGAGNVASTVRNTTVQHSSIAAPPKITFGHPTGGYAQTNTSYYQSYVPQQQQITTIATNPQIQTQTQSIVNNPQTIQTVTNTVVKESGQQQNVSQIVRANPAASSTNVSTYAAKNTSDDFLCGKWCWILTALIALALLTLALLYGLGVIGGSTPSANLNAPKVSANLPSVNGGKFGLNAPNINAPNLSLNGPNVAAPSLNLNGPNIGTPNLDINGPKLNAPNFDFNGPKINAPNVDISTPHINTPSVDINGPKINAPNFDFDGKIGKVGAPSLNLDGPKVSAPNVDINGPHIGTPSLNVNGVTGSTSVSSLPVGQIAPTIGSTQFNPVTYNQGSSVEPASISPQTVEPVRVAPVTAAYGAPSTYGTTTTYGAPTPTSVRPTTVQPTNYYKASSTQPTVIQPHSVAPRSVVPTEYPAYNTQTNPRDYFDYKNYADNKYVPAYPVQ